MTSLRFLILILCSIGLAACNKPVSFDQQASTSVAASETLVYKVTRTSGTSTTTDDVAYVDFAKQRLVVVDFNRCFSWIPLSIEDIADIQAAFIGASSDQTQAQAACSLSADAYSVSSSSANSTYAVCGTDLQTKIEEIMSRPSTLMCKATF